MKCSNPDKAEKIFAYALKRIKPSEKEMQRSFGEAEKLIGKLQRVLPEAVEVRLAGSLAKGTNLKGKNEFDIFLLFPRHYQRHELTVIGLSHARRAFAGMRVESRYAEHPYLQVISGSYLADIVPAYKIEDASGRGTAVDRSPLHTVFVNSRLNQAQKDQVRLLKQFMKNFGIYGAELRVEGFSGYLCELLVAKYGSLLSLMEAASGWSHPVIFVDGEGDEKEAREKFTSPLVVIDPVDPSRNVAAVVAQTSLSRFIFECRRFLKSPSSRFFFSKKRIMGAGKIRRAIKERGTECLAALFPAPKAIPDILWPQLKKTAQALVRLLEENGFGVFGYYHWSDGEECAILFELSCGRLPSVKKVVGPSISFAADVEAFVKKHNRALNIHLEHDRIVAVERRKESSAKRLLAGACKNPKGLGVPALMGSQLGCAKVLPASSIASGKRLEFLSDYFFAKIA
ncbi:MAG: CCA tRNA nucleotidyltransferase [Candidatus Micrarchaeota archaeon]|nr:CCA tRNA nucleotidyltransferase [Candidatus Micrarchaeota archaeon]